RAPRWCRDCHGQRAGQPGGGHGGGAGAGDRAAALPAVHTTPGQGPRGAHGRTVPAGVPAMTAQSAQALLEWAIPALVLILFAFGILAVGEVVGEYMAVRSAASQAAFAAARAPSAAAAQAAAGQAAEEAIAGSHLQDFQLTLDLGGFERGAELTAE